MPFRLTQLPEFLVNVPMPYIFFFIGASAINVHVCSILVQNSASIRSATSRYTAPHEHLILNQSGIILPSESP